MGQIVDNLVASGYGGYRGWDDANAQADFNAGHGDGKKTGGGSSGPGVPPAFNFDYAAEATKAYGELGPYYTRLIEWAQGDMNKVLSRLTEDYDRGLRVKKEDTAAAKDKVDLAQGQADIRQDQSQENIKNNLLARGLYQKSLDANANEVSQPFEGFGIGDVNFKKTNDNFQFQKDARATQKTQLDTNMTRYSENAAIIKRRGTEDATQTNERNKFKLEDERKLRSGDIANERGQRAYQDYINKFSVV